MDKDEGEFEKIVDRLKLDEITGGNKDMYERYMLSKHNENALDLSEGQWQRLAVARGLYKKDASVLLMDEPSSALDAYTEDMLYNSVRDDDKYNIKFIITHRLAYVKDITRIIVLEKGHIIEDGNHTQLIRDGKLYAELFTTQSEKYS